MEVKSARLIWDSCNKHWQLRFKGIKHGKFDVLVLGVLLPAAVQLWEYKDTVPPRTRTWGRSTSVEGGVLDRIAGKGKDLSAAWNGTFMSWLQSIAELRDEWSTTSEVVKNVSLSLLSPTDHAYIHPLDMIGNMPNVQRGSFCSCLSRLRDDCDASWEATRDSWPGLTYKGQRRRGQNNAKNDYVRLVGSPSGEAYFRRVEVKSARVSWNKVRCHWQLVFHGIKPDFFDDLVLAVYLPWGVQLWEAMPLSVLPRLARQGKFTETRGYCLSIHAGIQHPDLESAWQLSIKPKLLEMACERSSCHWSHPLLEKAAQARVRQAKKRGQ